MTTSQLIAATSLVLAFGAHAAEEATSAQPVAPVAPPVAVAPAASAIASADAPKVVCTCELLVGSRLPTRVCRTVHPAMDDFYREETRRLIHQGAPAGAQGIAGRSGGRRWACRMLASRA